MDKAGRVHTRHRERRHIIFRHVPEVSGQYKSVGSQLFLFENSIMAIRNHNAAINEPFEIRTLVIDKPFVIITRNRSRNLLLPI